MTKTRDTERTDSADRLPSDDLAALIVDALLRAGIVNAGDVARAVRIASEEIKVRKTLGDY
jgi:hypothetical protein